MQINILFLIIVIIWMIGIHHGYKVGLVEGLLRAIALISGIFVLGIILIGIYNFMNHKVANVLVALILIVALGIVYKIIHLPLESLKVLSKLPILKGVDKIAGVAIGILEATIFIWFIFLVLQYLDMTSINNWIINQANQNAFVSLLYKSNYVVNILNELLK